MIKCENCSNEVKENFEDIGLGKDENGYFTDYKCKDCGNIVRVYIKRE